MASDPPSGSEILAHIRRQSAERRADPRRFLCAYLQEHWAYEGEDAARAAWPATVERFPWYAQDVLACMDAVIADPPQDLVDMLSSCGSIALGEQPDGSYDTPPLEAHVEWLRALRRDFGRVYDAATGAS